MTLANPVKQKTSQTFWAVYRLAIKTGILGGILYACLIIGLPLMSRYNYYTISYGLDLFRVFFDLAGYAVFGAVFGFAFGTFFGICDGLILSYLVTRGMRNPYKSSSDRRLFCIVSAISVGGLTFLFTSPLGILNLWRFILPLSFIAAIGGWWVAHRVFTQKPRVIKQNPPTLSHETQ